LELSAQRVLDELAEEAAHVELPARPLCLEVAGVGVALVVTEARHLELPNRYSSGEDPRPEDCDVADGAMGGKAEQPALHGDLPNDKEDVEESLQGRRHLGFRSSVWVGSGGGGIHRGCCEGVVVLGTVQSVEGNQLESGPSPRVWSAGTRPHTNLA
jgi:hypothetical protein